MFTPKQCRPTVMMWRAETPMMFYFLCAQLWMRNKCTRVTSMDVAKQMMVCSGDQDKEKGSWSIHHVLTRCKWVIGDVYLDPQVKFTSCLLDRFIFSWLHKVKPRILSKNEPHPHNGIWLKQKGAGEQKLMSGSLSYYSIISLAGGAAYPKKRKRQMQGWRKETAEMSDVPCNTSEKEKTTTYMMHVLAHNRVYPCEISTMTSSSSTEWIFSKSLIGCREHWFRVGSFSDTPAAYVPCVGWKPVIEHGLPSLQGTHWPPF